MTSLGVWVDEPKSTLLTSTYWKELLTHGIQTAAIMLEGNDPGFTSKFTATDLEKICALALEHDIELVLTIWPEPTVDYLADLEEKLPKLIEKSGCAGIECDLEGNWKSSNVKGFTDLAKASDVLVKLLKRFRTKYDVRLEMTTFPDHPENAPGAMVAPHMDRLLPQAYSVRNRTNTLVAWDGKYGPGHMQTYTLNKTLHMPSISKLSCGLAAYDQKWPDHSVAQALQLAYDTAMEYNPIEVRFWSSKWIFGKFKEPKVSTWLKSLSK